MAPGPEERNVDFSRCVAFFTRVAAPARGGARAQGRRLLGTVAVALSLVAVAPAGASAQLPAQGIYEACYPGVDPAGCAARLQLIGWGGFGVVLNYWMMGESGPEAILSYVATAAARNVQTIWPLNDWWQSSPTARDLLDSHPLLAQNCGCADNQGLLAYVIGLARTQPGTWGYYVADEPDPARHDQLAAFVAQVKAADPTHPVLVVGCGICHAGGDPTGAAVAPFADIGDVLASDSYPVRSGPVNDLSAMQEVASTSEGVQQVAGAAGRPSAMVLQAWNWNDSLDEAESVGGVTHFPTALEIALQRDVAMVSGHPALILWFGLFDVLGYDPGQQPAYFLAPPDPPARWAALVEGAFSPEPQATPSTGPPPAGGRLRIAVWLRAGRRRPGVRVTASASVVPARPGVSYGWWLGGRRLGRCRRSTCSFRWPRGNPFLEARVSDANGGWTQWDGPLGAFALTARRHLGGHRAL